MNVVPPHFLLDGTRYRSPSALNLLFIVEVADEPLLESIVFPEIMLRHYEEYEAENDDQEHDPACQVDVTGDYGHNETYGYQYLREGQAQQRPHVSLFLFKKPLFRRPLISGTDSKPVKEWGHQDKGETRLNG